MATPVNLTGTPAADTLFFESADPITPKVEGFAGNDSIYLGADLVGGLVDGGTGNDSIFLEGFNSTVGSITDTTIKLGEGSDTLKLDYFQKITGLFLNGNAGDDSILFDINVDTLDSSRILGGQGNDTFYFGVQESISNTSINGNEGNDSIFVGPTEVFDSQVFGGQGSDTIYISATTGSGLLVDGNIDDDSIFVKFTTSLEESEVFGGEGNDSLYFEVATLLTTTVDGGNGDDSIYLSGTDAENVNVLAGSGNDTVQVLYTDFTDGFVQGLDGNDSIYVTDASGTTLINANQGTDTLLGFLYDSARALGGQGNDSLYIYELENDAIANGNKGDDTVYSAAQDGGEARGGEGDDYIFVTGTGGDVYGDKGADTIDFGLGKFTANYAFGDTALIGSIGWDSIQNFIDDVDALALESGPIVFNIAGLSGGITVVEGLATAGISSLGQLIAAGQSLTTEGALIAWDEFLFISDGSGTESEDLLIKNSATITKITLTSGEITGLLV